MSDIHDKKDHIKKISLISSIIVVALLVVVIASATVAEFYTKDKIYSGISIGPIDVGGKTKEQALIELQDWQDKWWEDQMKYKAVDEQGKVIKEFDFLPLVVTEGNGQSYEIIWFDWNKSVAQAFATGRDKNPVVRTLNQLSLLYSNASLEVPLGIDELQLQHILELELSEFETYPQEASLAWSSAYSDPQIISENSGNTFDYKAAVEDTKSMLLQLKNETVNIKRQFREAKIKTSDVMQAKEEVSFLSEQFPLTLNYFDPVIDFERKWKLTWAQVFNAIQPEKLESGTVRLALQEESLEDIWGMIELRVNHEAQDAKFEVGEGNRVQQFQPSKDGYSLNRTQTLDLINTYLYSEKTEDDPKTITIAVEVDEPQVKTQDVNDLGITEVLGVGYSNFSGSPSNRVHNIGVGASKLNGLLIAPDEEFSLLNALKPFTIAGGYLPELVIKGDKIVPEIGGGLCQIGSTTFRATMKSGLPVTERRNHSLVVSYYNDHRNGNPGTDATIYDPSPDYKFTNDTGNYILITTEMNRSTGDLFFTFWGTSDGRKADYTEPVVSKWIPAGETQYIETPDLEPGEQKCQGAHPGAVTSFTYKIERPDGTVEEEVYSSHYRALPQICLVGANQESEIVSESEEVSTSVTEQN